MNSAVEPKMNPHVAENDTVIISICCSKENGSAFMDAWKDIFEMHEMTGDISLCSGYMSNAHALICDAEGMEKLNDVLSEQSSFPLLFLLDEPISSFWRESAEYVFQPPYGYEAILRQALKIAGKTIQTPSKSLIQRQAQACLESLCIPSRLLGHKYLVEGALKLFAEPHPGRPGLLQEIYAHIARQYDSSPVMVDRAIRHGVEVCWKKSSPENSNLSSATTTTTCWVPPPTGSFSTPSSNICVFASIPPVEKPPFGNSFISSPNGMGL